MVYSMTAFTRQQQTGESGEFSLEIRSVNHRYLDLNLRLPDELRGFEPLIREQVAQRVARGKLDITLRFQPPVCGETLDVDYALVEKLARTSHAIDKYIYNPAPVNALELMHWPGVIRAQTVDSEQLQQRLGELLDAALNDLQAMRGREGAKLRKALLQRCDAIEAILAPLEQALPAIRQAMRDKLQARLAALSQELDEDRLEQELVLLAQKADVDEELDRLRMHLGEIREVLDAAQPVGRRLDFLMQELHREANTLGSKSVDRRMTRASVDLKVLIEQMREQVQNIE
ncbi:YicC/YloC family endoribonuclease [Thiohalophilus sp.]|uniref:YicC/YloC family endoribonuclease n=1 Tax=Thiohalophilus sp. TaxID=3028392 RepID=UPI002ACE782C|nr:YicC/YloC family endoribonuclease [Thiohalophilus sp.]MDZ7661728.1 YicC/YloC family endoribonuclease [Thiohalophilus sp.]